MINTIRLGDVFYCHLTDAIGIVRAIHKDDRGETGIYYADSEDTLHGVDCKYTTGWVALENWIKLDKNYDYKPENTSE